VYAQGGFVDGVDNGLREVCVETVRCTIWYAAILCYDGYVKPFSLSVVD
jgi:hypothetical protein